MAAKNWTSSSPLRTTGSCLGRLGQARCFEDPVAPQGDVVEEAKGLEVLVVVAPGGPPLLDQVEQVGAASVGPEESGDLPKWRAKRATQLT